MIIPKDFLLLNLSVSEHDSLAAHATKKWDVLVQGLFFGP